MKITEIKTTMTNCSLKAAITDKNYISTFGKTVTQAEKDAKLYADWSDRRVGEMVQAFAKQYIAWCPEGEDLKFDIGIPLSHTLVKLIGRGQIKVAFDFAGTRETVKTDHFEFVLNSFNTDELVPDNNLPENFTNTQVVLAEGDAPEMDTKYGTYYDQIEQLGKIYKSLSTYINPDNQIEFIQLVAFLVINAELMCETNATDFELAVNGLSLVSEQDPEKIKFLEETSVVVTGKKTAVEYGNFIGMSSGQIN